VPQNDSEIHTIHPPTFLSYDDEPAAKEYREDGVMVVLSPQDE
jgi:hypothetical protein